MHWLTGLRRIFFFPDEQFGIESSKNNNRYKLPDFNRLLIALVSKKDAYFSFFSFVLSFSRRLKGKLVICFLSVPSFLIIFFFFFRRFNGKKVFFFFFDPSFFFSLLFSFLFFLSFRRCNGEKR